MCIRDRDTVTDQPERQTVAEIIREKALHSLNEEIPHGIAVAIDQMKMRNKGPNARRIRNSTSCRIIAIDADISISANELHDTCPNNDCRNT